MIEIAPGIKRTSRVYNKSKNRKYPIELEKKIAHEYFVKKAPLKKISIQFSLSKKKIRTLMRPWEDEREKPYVPQVKIPENKELVLIIEDPAQMEFLMFLLHEWQIKFRMPENFEITEYFKSKL